MVADPIFYTISKTFLSEMPKSEAGALRFAIKTYLDYCKVK
jgi:hypothetical protein